MENSDVVLVVSLVLTWVVFEIIRYIGVRNLLVFSWFQVLFTRVISITPDEILNVNKGKNANQIFENLLTMLMNPTPQKTVGYLFILKLSWLLLIPTATYIVFGILRKIVNIITN